MKRKLEIFHEGEAVPRTPGDTQTEEEIAVSERARTVLEKLFRAVEEEGKTPYLFFDIDRVLVPWGLDSPFNSKTIAEFATENRGSVDAFKRKIEWFKKSGFRFVIITAREVDSARRVAKNMFPKNSVDTISGEKGSVIVTSESGKDIADVPSSLPSYLDRKKVASFRNLCAPLVAFCNEELGGPLSEEKKEVEITLIPPKTVQNPEAMSEFYRSILEKAKQIGIGSDIAIDRSGYAVDVTLSEATKIRALREILGDNVKVYLGGSTSDEEAMGDVSVNIVPGNALESTKAQARKAQIGLVAERQDMAGVVDALSTIEAYMRLRNMKKGKVDGKMIDSE